MYFSRSHDAVIRVYDDAGNVIETHEHAGEFKEWRSLALNRRLVNSFGEFLHFVDFHEAADFLIRAERQPCNTSPYNGMFDAAQFGMKALPKITTANPSLVHCSPLL